MRHFAFALVLTSIPFVFPAPSLAAAPYENVQLRIECDGEAASPNFVTAEGTISISTLSGSRFRQTARAKARLRLKLTVNGITVYQTVGLDGFDGTYRAGEGTNEDSEYDEAILSNGSVQAEFEFFAETLTVKRQGAVFFTRCKISK